MENVLEVKNLSKTYGGLGNATRALDAVSFSVGKGEFVGVMGASGSGKAGSPNGNSTSGSLTGKPGIGGLGGYTLENWSRPSSSLEGTITIQVKVNARGNVVSASYASGTGAAAGNQAARSSCIAAARQSSFSVPKNTTTDAVGTITYRFE